MFGTFCAENNSESSREYCSELGHQVLDCCPIGCVCEFSCGGGTWVATECEGGKSCNGVGGPPTYCDETTEGQTATGGCYDCS